MNSFLLILKKPTAAAFTGIALIIILHFIFPSYLNGLQRNYKLKMKYVWDSEHADKVLNERSGFSEFARRPITSGLQILLKEHAGIPYQFSFNLAILISLFLCCLVIKNIFFFLNPNQSIAYISVYGFLLSYATLFAFMASMHTYDEPLQFLFILLAFLFHLKRNDLTAIVFFSVACITRESTFILLPFFLLTRKGSIKTYLLWIFPLVVYTVFFKYALPDWVQSESVAFSSKNRLLGWTENFKTWKSSLISITNLFLVLALPILLIRKFIAQLSYQSRVIFKYAEILIYLNAIIVLVAGLAKEPRLFALPLILIWPLLPNSVNALFINFQLKEIHRQAFALILIISFIYSFFLFGHALGKGGALFKAYLFAYLSVCLGLKFGLKKGQPTSIMPSAAISKHSS